MANGPDKADIAEQASSATVGGKPPAKPTPKDQNTAKPAGKSRIEEELEAQRLLLIVKDQEIARLRATAAQHAHDLAEREIRIKVANEARSASDRRLKQYAEQLRSLTASQQALLENRRTLDMARGTVERELRETRQALEKATHDIIWIDGEKDGLRKDLTLAQDALEKAAHDIIWIDGEKDGLRQELTLAQQALEKAAHDIAWIDGEKDGLRQDIANRDAQLDGLREAQQVQANAQQSLKQHVTELTAELAVAKQALSTSEDALGQLRSDLTGVEGNLAERDERLAQLTAERDTVAQSVIALETRVSEGEKALGDRQGKIDALTRELAGKAEQFASQLAQLAASKAKQATLAQDHADALDQLNLLTQELSQTRDLLSQRQDEAQHYNEFAQTKIAEVAKRDEELATAHKEAAGLKQAQAELTSNLQQAGIKLGDLQQNLEDRLREALNLQGRLQESERQIDAQQGENRNLTDRLSQTESALRQRQFETEQQAEELRAAQRDIQNGLSERQQIEQKLKSALEDLAHQRTIQAQTESNHETQIRAATVDVQLQKDLLAQAERTHAEQVETMLDDLRVQKAQLAEAEQRHAMEQRAALTDLSLQKALLVQTERQHESTLQARFKEIATLSSLLATTEGRVSTQMHDIGHLKLARNELARQGQSLHHQLFELVEALLVGADMKWLPRKAVLRRQRAILEKYDLFESDWYSQYYTDVAPSGVDGITHYLTLGRNEGRAPNRAIATFQASASMFLNSSGS